MVPNILTQIVLFSINHLVGWLFRFYGISIFVGYLMPNTFFILNKSVPFKTIQFSMSIQFVRDISISSQTVLI